jgi:inositol-phosphate phosphatase/L-galactose 1-phosphate phosphatase/histidinol-phosphatase
MQEFVTFAKGMADEAGNIIRQYFRQPFDIETKADDSPVTIADRAVEQRLREMIEKQRPDDGIFGEEFARKPSKNGLTWVIDPIDGTKSFMIGRPTFGTLIALWEGNTPLLGIIDQAISGERWIGADGVTTFNGQAVKTRACTHLKSACTASTTPAMFKGDDALWKQFDTQTRMMAWGGDCYMYGLLASGFLDICIEASLKPYDYAAVVPVVQNAGGWISDYDGKPLTLESEGKVIALGDKTLWPEVRNLLT